MFESSSFLLSTEISKQKLTSLNSFENEIPFMIMSLEFNTNTGTNKDCSVPQQSEHLIATTPFLKACCSGVPKFSGSPKRIVLKMKRRPLEGGQNGRKMEKTREAGEGGVLTVHLMYSGLKPKIVFFYTLHRQTTCEHLDINRYEKRCVYIYVCVWV